jgi:hypothetical protein
MVRNSQREYLALITSLALCDHKSWGTVWEGGVLAVNSFKSTLLASSVLTTIGFGASATTLMEGVAPAPADFPNTSPGTSIDFSMFQSVTGTLTNVSDQADFFTFTGLTAGDDFSITFTTTAMGSSNSSFLFTADGFSETLGPGSSKTDTGVLSDAMLTVGVTDTKSGPGVGTAEGYSVTLSESPAGIPEPSTAALFAVGLAGLAVARRKRYH